MRYVSPNSPGSLVQYPDRYDHYILSLIHISEPTRPY